MSRKYFAGVLALAFLVLPANAQAAEKSHGLSAFGDLAYAADFKHFKYVNPSAPKGGTIRLRGIDSFDNLNGFILKGVVPEGLPLIHATLMERATDEPDALYGYVAKSVELPADKSWIIFELRPEARFNDGTRITGDDVVFTFDMLVKKGHPQYRIIFADVKASKRWPPRGSDLLSRKRAIATFRFRSPACRCCPRPITARCRSKRPRSGLRWAPVPTSWKKSIPEGP